MPDQQFDSDAMHRVKNHLAVILGFTELVMDDPSISPSVRGDIAEIRRAAQAALAELGATESTLP